MATVRRIIIGLSVLIIWEWSVAFTASQSAVPETDLYRIYIYSQEDADLLASLPVDPLWRLSDGYLVLVATPIGATLTSSGLRHELISAGVHRYDLALDIRHDRSNVGRYPLVFEENGIRIFRVPSPNYLKSRRGTGLAPIRTENISITYRPEVHLDASRPFSADSLAYVVDNISEDTLIAFSEHLQSYNGREAGTVGDYQSAVWAVERFDSWGYDSVIVDTFTEVIYDTPTLCRNVIAYKIGSEFPDDHIIIGAHRDAVLQSPGADDNGSGSVGVLEIARVLADVDTRTTIVFILFDAEEEGLFGSWYYAEAAAERDERIVAMFNMDMVGYYENTNEAHIMGAYAGDPYALLWASLADSIPAIGITGHFSVAGYGSDHYPFQQYGWNVAYVAEYIYSSVYHTEHDSTLYLGYDYMTRMIKATAAAAYVSDQQYIQNYELYMTFAGGSSPTIHPQVPTPIRMLVWELGGAQLVPGSVHLHYAVNGGDETTIPMGYAGGDVYEADLPPFDCLDAVDYFVTAEDDSLGEVVYPGEGETVSAILSTHTSTVFEDDFSTDQGWSVVSQTFGGEWYRLQSWDDYDGSHHYYRALGSPGIIDGTTSLISPPIDIDSNDCFFRYARWCANFGDPGAIPDYLTVYIRNASNGSWIPVETLAAADGVAGDWKPVQFRLSDFMAPPRFVQLKFDATENGGDGQMYAGVDAVQVIDFLTDTHIITESVPSWTAYLPYSQQLEAASCAEPISWADHFGQLEGTGLTLSEDGLLSGIPSRTGPVVFRALVTDQLGGYDEQILSIVIYDTLHVTTATIPAAYISESYSSQLRVSGGTGTKTWSDRDGDLAETGVTLSAAGWLSGMPAVDGDFPFTALVTDQVGATTEKVFTLHIVGPYICGDANGDSTVNIGDAVCDIEYIFKMGPPPYPIEAGDANADGSVNVGDAVYLINFIFKGGPPPQCPQ